MDPAAFTEQCGILSAHTLTALDQLSLSNDAEQQTGNHVLAALNDVVSLTHDQCRVDKYSTVSACFKPATAELVKSKVAASFTSTADCLSKSFI